MADKKRYRVTALTDCRGSVSQNILQRAWFWSVSGNGARMQFIKAFPRFNPKKKKADPYDEGAPKTSSMHEPELEVVEEAEKEEHQLGLCHVCQEPATYRGSFKTRGGAEISRGYCKEHFEKGAGGMGRTVEALIKAERRV